MLLNRENILKDAEDSRIWGPLGTVSSDWLILINGSFSSLEANLPRAQEGLYDWTFGWLLACSPGMAHHEHAQAWGSSTLLGGCRASEEMPGKAPLGGRVLTGPVSGPMLSTH